MAGKPSLTILRIRIGSVGPRGFWQELTVDRNYDITPDGRRLLVQMIAERSAPRAQEVDVVLNWTEELKRLVPTN